jgi:putative lipoprotein
MVLTRSNPIVIDIFNDRNLHMKPRFAALALALVMGGACAATMNVRASDNVADSKSALSKSVQVQGSVLYLQRIGLPRGAMLTVTVGDISRADAPARILARKKVKITGVPHRFALRVSRNLILNETGQSLRAEIRDARGGLLYVSDSHIPVVQDPFSNYVDVGEIVLVSAR